MNNTKNNIDILAKDFCVSRYNTLHWNDELAYGKHKIINDLMLEFYYRYLSSGCEYKCKVDAEHTSEAISGIEKVKVYLHIKKVEEEE